MSGNFRAQMADATLMPWPSHPLDSFQPLHAGAIGRYPCYRRRRRGRACSHRGRGSVSSAMEPPSGAVARGASPVRRESGVEATLAPLGGPRGGVLRRCAKRVQLGGAGRTARMLRPSRDQCRSPNPQRRDTDECAAPATRAPVCRWKVAATTEIADQQQRVDGSPSQRGKGVEGRPESDTLGLG